jgi:putative CocE/NonD family hydrolase
MKTRLRFLLITALAASQVRAAEDKPEELSTKWLAEHYTKYEHRIPMRDGVRLFTRVFVPKDDSTPWPIVLTRTPYALKPYGSDNFMDPAGSSFGTLARDKFILVAQDVRGRYGSEGTFMHVRPHNPAKGPRDTDESSDTWDTIEWLVKNVPNNNGKAGLFGISYPGFYTAMGMIDSHPALKAASPQAPVTDWFIGDDLHHNGAFFLAQNFDFFYKFAQKVEDPLRDTLLSYRFGTPDGYDFFLRMGPLGNSEKLFKSLVPEWSEFLAHPNYDDYWKARDPRPHLKNVRCAVMTVGGWFDAEDLFGPLEVYRNTERLNPGIDNTLVMGPWSHGQWGKGPGDKLGHISFHSKTSEYYREKIELPFFRRHLKDDKGHAATEAHIFETGTHRWRRFDSWPPKQVKPRTLYFHPAGALSFDPPKEKADAHDEYPSDPAKPVPFTNDPSQTYPKAYPIEDQRFVASRPDVLVYQTEPLEEDITFAGPLKATLHVSTTGTDSDFVVKLVDVYPGDFPNPDPNPADVKLGGYQQLVRGDVFRGRFRNSFEKPEPFEPGKPARIEMNIPDICHNFRRGHRIMVQVQSSWFPLVDRNPQTFVDNIAKAKPEDFQKATQRVYRGGEMASCLTAHVLYAEKK